MARTLVKQRQFYTSAIINAQSAAVTSIHPTFTTFSTSPTFTFTPTSTGTYKVWCPASIYTTGAANEASCRIFNTVGGATLLSESQAEIYVGASAILGSITAVSTYTLTAGVAYTFVIQGASATGANVFLRGGVVDFYMFAEQVL